MNSTLSEMLEIYGNNNLYSKVQEIPGYVNEQIQPIIGITPYIKNYNIYYMNKDQWDDLITSCILDRECIRNNDDIYNDYIKAICNSDFWLKILKNTEFIDFMGFFNKDNARKLLKLKDKLQRIYDVEQWSYVKNCNSLYKSLLFVSIILIIEGFLYSIKIGFLDGIKSDFNMLKAFMDHYISLRDISSVRHYYNDSYLAKIPKSQAFFGKIKNYISNDISSHYHYRKLLRDQIIKINIQINDIFSNSRRVHQNDLFYLNQNVNYLLNDILAADSQHAPWIDLHI